MSDRVTVWRVHNKWDPALRAYVLKLVSTGGTRAAKQVRLDEHDGGDFQYRRQLAIEEGDFTPEEATKRARAKLNDDFERAQQQRDLARDKLIELTTIEDGLRARLDG